MTRQEATMQANLLRLYDRLPEPLARVLWRSVANPEARSDTLLILADALRDFPGTGATQVADAIATLAPSRANPLREIRDAKL